VSGQKLYIVTLTTVTLVYSFDSKMWSEWTSGADGSLAFIGSHAADGPNGMAYILGRTTGIVYTISEDHFTDGGTAFLCQIITPKYDFDMFNRKFMSRFNLIGDVPTTSGTGNIVQVAWSDDDYVTWSANRDLSFDYDFPSIAPDDWGPPQEAARPTPISYESLVPSFLRDMFKNGPQNPNQQRLDKSLDNLIQSPVKDERGFWDKLGLRGFGITSDDVFKEEAANPAMRDTRMGMLGTGIGTLGNAFMSASPMGPAMSAVRGYDSYMNDPTKNVMNAVAKGASGMGGYIGALGNLYSGNYGNALTGVLGKAGVSSPARSLAGIGVNFAQGKNVAPSLGGLAGQFLGRSAGGNVGATLGKTLGQQFGGSYSIRK